MQVHRSVQSVLVLGVVGLGSVSLLHGGLQRQREGWLPHPSQTLTIPLPEVSRQKSERATPFDDPALVAIVQVRQNWEIEDTDRHGKSLIPDPRSYVVQRAELVRIVRVNERRKQDPDLAMAVLVVNQKDRLDDPIRLKFGKPYILFLNPARDSAFYLDIDHSKQPYDAYVLALPQGGFEVVDGRLRPLLAGGPLDAYSGKDATSVMQEQLRK